MNIALFRVMKSFTSGRQALGMGGGEEFSTIARELALRGHRLTIYCDIFKKSKDELESWGIRLRPDDMRIDDDEDCLLVDNGAGMNMLWNPQQMILPRRFEKFYNLVASANVPIFYSQSDPAAGMCLVTETDMWLDLPSKKALLDYISVPKNPFNGKKVIVMLAQHWPDEFAKKLKSKYCQMEKYGMLYEHLDLSTFALIGREYLDPQPTVGKDVVYVGHARYRSRLAKYLNRKNAWVWGRWPETTRNNLIPNANYHEKIGADKVPGVYQDGRMTVAVKDDVELGFCARPTRVFESVQAGCPIFVDERTFRDGVDDFRYWKWILKPEQVDRALAQLADDSERLRLIREQREVIREIDPLAAIDDLEAILEKHVR